MPRICWCSSQRRRRGRCRTSGRRAACRPARRSAPAFITSGIGSDSLMLDRAGRRGRRHANVEVALRQDDLEREQEEDIELKHDVDHRRHLQLDLVERRGRGESHGGSCSFNVTTETQRSRRRIRMREAMDSSLLLAFMLLRASVSLWLIIVRSASTVALLAAEGERVELRFLAIWMISCTLPVLASRSARMMTVTSETFFFGMRA